MKMKKCVPLQKKRAKQNNSLNSSTHVQVQKAFHFANSSQEFQQ